MKKILYIIIIFGVLYSCNKPNNKVEISANERKLVFQDKYVSNPDTSFQISHNKLLFLKVEKTGKIDTNDNILNLIILERIGNKWGILRDTIILDGYYSIDSISVTSISDKLYLYYEEFIPGGSWGNLDMEFSLYELNTGERYYIHYTEEPESGYVLTKFTKSDNLDSNNVLSKYLVEKISKSNRIHKIDPEEKIVRQFLFENEKSINELANPYSKNQPIQFQSVSTKEVVFDTKKASDTVRSIVTAIQNEEFIIISRFKGPVLGYNKLTSDFFCVWVPDDLYNWIRKIGFNSMGNLIIYDGAENPQYLINLHNSIYIRLQ